MGGKYSITARNLDDKGLVVCDYHNPLPILLLKWVYCIIKYDVVTLGKHW